MEDMTNEELQTAIIAILKRCSNESLKIILSCAIHITD